MGEYRGKVKGVTPEDVGRVATMCLNHRYGEKGRKRGGGVREGEGGVMWEVRGGGMMDVTEKDAGRVATMCLNHR